MFCSVTKWWAAQTRPRSVCKRVYQGNDVIEVITCTASSSEALGYTKRGGNTAESRLYQDNSKLWRAPLGQLA